VTWPNDATGHNTAQASQASTGRGRSGDLRGR
jgi:hypothetical protein